MYLVLILFGLIWVSQRNKQVAQGSAASRSGGWHGPDQTTSLGGSNVDGNMFDNGTTQPIFNSQWTGSDKAVGNLVFAVQGGEDGQNPAQTVQALRATPITALGRFSMVGGSDPSISPTVPNQVSSINPVVRR
jgi:hypothetical protein